MAATPANSLTLISSGLQDARLSSPRGNPNTAHILTVLKKRTRWAAQYTRIDFDGQPQFGQRITLTVPRKGELIRGVTLALTFPDIYTPQLAAIKAAGGTSFEKPGNFLGPVFGWTNSVGHALIQQVELEIGGAIVERFDSRLLEILDELYETVESATAKSRMIARKANGFTARTWLSSEPLTVYVPIPFWFSKPGVLSHALPIEALTSEIVRIHVTLAPVEQLFYTEARADPRSVGYADSPVTGAMYGIQNAQFWQSFPTRGTVYSLNAAMPPQGVPASVIPRMRMPARLQPQDAYMLIEYINVEEFEAIALRTGELTYHVEQHAAIPVINTDSRPSIVVPLPYSNPVKELLWVCQRPEATNYNAPFLFTRDLAAIPDPVLNLPETPCTTPWWPDASIVPSPAANWQIIPAFQQAYSEPLEGASLYYSGIERFVQEGGSFFRGVVPARSYVKSAVYNRYVYAYSFELKPERGKYTPTGTANWDKIAKKELYLTFQRGRRNTAPPPYNVYMYYTIWNVFKVFGGRGGMLFTS
jgi:hypothetical protein